MSRVIAVTVARRRDLAGARVLSVGLRAHHPEIEHLLILLPGLGPSPRTVEPFTVIPAGELRESEFRRILPFAPLAAVEALARPLALDHALNRGADVALLLAPDVEVLGALESFFEGLRAHDAVLVPRVKGRLPDDGHRPDAADLINAGEIDDGIVALRASAEARALLEWWIDQAREGAWAAGRLPEHIPAQLLANPLHAAEHAGASIASLDDPGYGVSYWNLHEHRLARRNGTLFAADRPVRVIRFAGFRPDRPWWLSEAADRTLVLDDPLLSDIVRQRAAALLEAGWSGATDLESGPAQLPNGLKLDRRLRRMYVEALERGEDFGDLTTPAGAEAFTSWLTEPAPAGGHAGLTRYHHDVWLERRDVREAYPHLEAEHGEGYAGWLWTNGRVENDLQTALMPPWPEFLGAPAVTPAAPPPVLVAGYLRGNLGLGEATRSCVDALRAAHVPVATRTLRPDPPVERLPRGARQRPDERAWSDLQFPDGTEAAVNLLCVNADQTAELAQDLASEGLGSRYTIGYWAWETDVIPDRWGPAYELVDEVWAYSTYVAENISQGGNIPVVVMPLPVAAPDAEGARLPIDIPDGFVFLFVFDFFSTLERKNPVGLVEAFSRAFAPGEGPTLLIKTINAEFRREPYERLRYSIAGRPDIKLVDATLTPTELASLFHRADAYVSLHRAEGFGLTLAESMALGKPVIATGFSGNTDFMTPHNSWLVDWTLTTVGTEAEHYPADGHWAEPNADSAVAAMREVVGAPAEAARRGRRAAQDISAALSHATVGQRARDRLLRVAALKSAEPLPPTPQPWPINDLSELVSFDLEHGVGRRGARGALRRALLRALRPYTKSERHLDEALVGSIDRLWYELLSERGIRDRELRHIRDLEMRLRALEERDA
jgi:glycosyltransferase involved in cell wall biosynthesis